MQLKEIRPIIRTRQLPETIAFYEQLGFTCAEYNEEWGWAAFQRDKVALMAALPLENEPFDRPVFTGSLYFLLEEGVDELWAAFAGKAEVCYAPETFPYGMREFAVFDNNGYLLQFGQPVAWNKENEAF